MLEHTDPATGEKKTTFNPVWIQFFVDLGNLITKSGGGGGGTLGGGTTGSPPAIGLTGHLVAFANDAGNVLADGGPPVVFVDRKELFGTVDGGNTVFTTAIDSLHPNEDEKPNPPESLFLYYYRPSGLSSVNGIYISGFDYVLSADCIITFDIAPLTGDRIFASYRYYKH
jgi:hypothetical protein